MLPDADLVIKCLDDYPVKVKISDLESGKVVWEAPQRRLFRKYAADRAKAIEEIKGALGDLK